MVAIDGQTSSQRHGRISKYSVEGFAETQTMHLDTGSVTSQEAFMLIDISDTTNWKHTQTDHVVIRHILIEVDPDSTYLGEVKIGFLDNVGAINGEFHQIIDLDLAKKSDLVIEDLVFAGGFHCQNSTHFGPHTVSTLFQTDTELKGPDGGVAAYSSGNGDLCLIVEVAAGACDVSITIVYETVGA